jgi:hypothetical protein
MIKKDKSNTLKLIKSTKPNIPEVNTSSITCIMNSLSASKGNVQSGDLRIIEMRAQLDSIIDSFQMTYRQLVTHEVKLLNLDIAADNIVKRNEMVDDIYQTVTGEIERQINQ